MTDIAAENSQMLLASNKIEGTDVYNYDGDKLGSVYNFMVDKQSGQVEYAVLQFGGFLGMGSDYYPVPWAALKYDVKQRGYLIKADKTVLEKAPRYASMEAPLFTQEYGTSINRAYGIQ
jgi:sporulation protein YlmC with PRC-barrel domain